MQQPLEDPWVDAFAIALLSASLATWILLITLKLRRGWILPHVPREPVPWGPIGGLLAIVLVCVALFAGGGAGDPPDPLPDLPNPVQTVEGLVSLIFGELFLVGSALAAIAVMTGASLRDLGLPVYADELAADVKVGMVAFLASLAPVFGLQALLYLLLAPDEPERNPLIEMVMREPDLAVMILATIAAVIVAPLCEEIVFRLLLQGWLEKWDGWHSREEDVDVLRESAATELAMQANEQASVPPSDQIPVDASATLPAQPDSSEALLVETSVRPHGWSPILGSSLLFALAHFGYGTDPVPIFVLALILGYVYHRTHRIAPCIVTHALFNLVTMLTLWWMFRLHFE